MISHGLFRLTNLLEREDKCNPVSLTAWKDSTPLGVDFKNLKQKHMTSIIFWTAIAITHVVNARLWKVEPTSFWYKSSWFFIGFSIACLMYFIGEYVSH
jgi:hypothetical protein